ncbi:amino acid permease [Sorangium sp. So ce1335]|uniref:amino acid permease n=1 Tax=Sorangium sp. So ce1335 TaxID=3133335 RepID=UPI003F62FC26
MRDAISTGALQGGAAADDAGVAADGRSDAEDLARLGYRQELKRDLGSLSAFAAGFSYVSILTTVFQLFVIGYAFGGTRFFWTWPVVFLGQLAVALNLAEVGSHYPVAGSVYQWGRRVSAGPPGWLAGWLKLLGDVVSVAAAAIALQAILPSVWSGFQFLGGDPSLTSRDGAANAVLLGAGLIVLTTAINMAGVKAMAYVNDIGVMAELGGVVLLIAALFLHAVRGPAIVLEPVYGPPSSLGTGAAGLLAAALMPAYVLYGFDSAGSLAEETRHPRRIIPRAILKAIVASGIGGALLILAALMAAPSLTDGRLATEGLAYVVVSALGPTLGKVFLVDVALAVCVCTLAIQTGASRLAFSMARDGALPCAAALSRVSARTKTPVAPAIVVGALACGMLAVNYGEAQLFVLITETAVLLVNLSYLLVTAGMLVRRLRGWPGRPEAGVFSLGRAGLALNAAAVAWGVALIANIAWPRHDGGGPAWLEYFPLIGVAGATAAGLALFLAMKRPRGDTAAPPGEAPAPHEARGALAERAASAAQIDLVT